MENGDLIADVGENFPYRTVLAQLNAIQKVTITVVQFMAGVDLLIHLIPRKTTVLVVSTTGVNRKKILYFSLLLMIIKLFRIQITL